MSLREEIEKFSKISLKPTETEEKRLPVVDVPPVPTTGPPDGKYLGHSDDDAIREFEDSEDKVVTAIKQLVELMKESNHTVFYTGAGISTAAKIPDFRGPKGVWTMRDRGKTAHCEITMEAAQPTLAHMAIVQLLESDTIQYLVSQNVDGLHRRSGVPAHKISELHGNCWIERCEVCHKEKLCTFDVTTRRTNEMRRTDWHHTGRPCLDKHCRGQMRDNIINFGENLPEEALDLGMKHSKKADLAVVLGSSCTVTPASHLPQMAKQLVICNLQRTPLDKKAKLVIHAKTDEVMSRVMKELGLAIPAWSPDY